MSSVWIVTNNELGWDCIVGVFDPELVTKEQLEERFPREYAYVVHYGPTQVHTNLEEFD